MLIIINMSVWWLFILLIVNQISGSSYNQPKFCSSATWNPNATTFANESVVSSLPWGVFVNINNTVYIAEKSKDQVQVWLEGNMTPSRTIYGSLYIPFAIFVTLDGDIYVDNGRNHNRVDMWTSNSTNSTTVMNVSDTCYGLFVDLYNTLYCSIDAYHQVVTRSLSNGSNTSSIIAGNGTNGSGSTMLSHPRGIFIDNRSNLYVADCGNNRIQLFEFGQLNATTVVENGTIIGTVSLNCPTGIVLDGDGYLFITDYNNNRIVRSVPNGFQCIAGCTCASGSAPNQLFYPRGLSFDSYGNIFVADGYNNRTQKFLLATNSCEETTTNDFQSTTMSTLTLGTSLITTSHQNVQQASGSFVPVTCPNATYIGLGCSISNAPCDMLQPCQNNGTCYNNATLQQGYVCSCQSGFNGTNCEFDYQPCKPNTCWNEGICNETSNTTFYCLCKPGWEGDHCEIKINYCLNITCQNKGVCKPLFMNYTCECLGESYSGRHCEITSSQTVVRQTMSKSFAFIAILSMVILAIFIISMDVLKYVFGIDPVREERERIRRQKPAKKRKPIIQKFVYVNAPPVATTASVKFEETAI